jgi:hypothetical protein
MGGDEGRPASPFYTVSLTLAELGAMTCGSPLFAAASKGTFINAAALAYSRPQCAYRLNGAINDGHTTGE